MSTLGVNSTLMMETPSSDTEEISLVSDKPLSLRSMGMVTSVSISSGATPSKLVITKIYGMVMSGSLSLGREA